MALLKSVTSNSDLNITFTQMDSLTHIAIGACIGEAFFDKGFGKKAMIWGALAQSIPDIDFIASFWMGTSEDLLAHRGFTHSILFGALITPVFALLADKVHRPHNIRFSKWVIFFSVEVFLHLFLDGFNNYGIGWLEPFSHRRFSLNAIYVADPLFSLWPGIACIFLFILHAHHPRREFWMKFGIILPFIYLTYCCINKYKINKDVQQIVALQNIPHQRYFTTPSPLNNWLWFVVSGNDSGYYVGFRSLFDKNEKIDFEFYPRKDSLLNPIKDQEDLQRLIRFSQQFYTVERWGDTLVFNDLRFGQMLGWQNPRGKFVFHYFLQQPKSNNLVVQRGRFNGWNWQVVKGLFNRIKGQ
jgi:inner membrane protein